MRLKTLYVHSEVREVALPFDNLILQPVITLAKLYSLQPVIHVVVVE